MAANPRTLADLETYAEKGVYAGAFTGAMVFCLYAVMNEGIKGLRENPKLYPWFVLGYVVYGAGGALAGKVTGSVWDCGDSFFSAPPAAPAPSPAQNNQQQRPRV